MFPVISNVAKKKKFLSVYFFSGLPLEKCTKSAAEFVYYYTYIFRS